MPLFRKREKTPAQESRDVSVVSTAVDDSTVSDVLLSALLSGETISREKAMNIPAVSSSVDLISSAVASMPVRLFKYKDEHVVEVKDDVRVSMLNGDTHDTLDGLQMKNALVLDYLLDGNGYCYIQRDGNDVTGLYYVDDQYIAISILDEPIYKTYTIGCGGGMYQPFEFIKLLRNTRDGARGFGITEEVSKALETAFRSMLYQLKMAKTNGNKRGFLKSERRLGQEEINLLKQAWNNLYSTDSEENVVVLNNGIDFKEASNTSVEMQLNETVKNLADQIKDIFHVYPNNFELTFKLAIYPVVKALETALNRDLLLEKEKGKYFFALDVKEIIRANVKERYEAYKLAKECGFMTINEMRREENMNHIEGLDIVDLGLGSVLYNTETHEYYTPNTDTIKTEEDDAVIDGEEGMT
ncbi:phage portal protein [uncultured Methanobrevibacter sp.]|mgnify:FL=1|uniref:phage portal protein n=1 Tax=uncultured Methanobrevibacter sp. TaxID=253161 RepID=UPI0026370CA5|nr:phage portal protein [uncultured Methanobrevibacter sp.]